MPCPSLGDLPNPGREPMSPALQADSLQSEPARKPMNTGVGSLSLLQGIFPSQELSWGLLLCRQILSQLSYQGSPLTGIVCLVTQSCPTLCDPMYYSLLGSSVHADSPGKNTGVGCHALLQGSSQPRDLTQISCIERGFFTV